MRGANMKKKHEELHTYLDQLTIENDLMRYTNVS